MNKNVIYLILLGLILYLLMRKKQQTADVKAAQAIAEKSVQLGTTTSTNGQTTVTTPNTTTGGTTPINTGGLINIPVDYNTPTTSPVVVTEDNINYAKQYEILTA